MDMSNITGVEVRQATGEVDTIDGAVMQLFPSSTVVQVFLLARSVTGDTWSVSEPDDRS